MKRNNLKDPLGKPNVKGRTLVYPDIAQNQFGTYLGKKIQEFTQSAGQKLVYLEDPIFEKTFAVYSTDQIEARYILTPAMMENLLKLTGKYGNRFTFSFTRGKLGVMVKEIPRFRVGTDVPLHTEAVFYNFIQPVEMAKDIIDILNLNTRIWEKS